MQSTFRASISSVVVGLAMVIGQSVAVAEVIPDFVEQIENGNFENTEGWPDFPGFGKPVGWRDCKEGPFYCDAEAFQRANLAGSGSTSMGFDSRDYLDYVWQSTGEDGDTVATKWALEFDFAADDPGNGVGSDLDVEGSPASTLLHLSTGSNSGLDLRFYDADSDGDGDLYSNNGFFDVELIKDAIIYEVMPHRQLKVGWRLPDHWTLSCPPLGIKPVVF